MDVKRRYEYVMAVVPSARGVAHVVFEGPFSPISWGAMDVRGDNRSRRSVEGIARLFGRFPPTALILQDMDGASNRPAAVRMVNDALAVFAETQGVEVALFTRDQVRESFVGQGLTSRQQVAEAIARRIPMFARLVPPPRRLWEAESRRMGIFDAAALVQTFYRTNMTGTAEEM